MTVTLITVGSGRPESFALCEKMIAAQTYKGEIQWIVVGDQKDKPIVCTMGQEQYYGGLEWTPGINTQRYNMNTAMSKVKGDYVFIIENDDYFSPEYIEVYLDFLKHAEMVGQGLSVYYNIAVSAYYEMGNLDTCSTTQTSFKKSYIPHFYKALNSGELFFDIKLWKNAQAAKHKAILFTSPVNYCVGIKGVPGREGIGFGHTNKSNFIPDTPKIKLRELVGQEYAKIYSDMVKPKQVG